MAPGGEIGQIWSLKQPLTYRTLSVLQSLGLAEVTAVRAGEGGPRRTELQATPRARRMVTRWLETPEPHVRDMRSGLLLKLHLLGRRGRSTVKLLTAQRELLLAQVETLATAGGDESDLDTLVRRWRHTMTVAALSFVNEMLERES